MTNVSSSSSSSSGIGFCGLLTIVFITLKLTGHIDWSWWWVLAPLWGSFVLFIVVLLGVVGWNMEMKDERKRRERLQRRQ